MMSSTRMWPREQERARRAYVEYGGQKGEGEKMVDAAQERRERTRRRFRL
jgi:hypothetical protein